MRALIDAYDRRHDTMIAFMAHEAGVSVKEFLAREYPDVEKYLVGRNEKPANPNLD